MGKIERFEDIEAWQSGREVTKTVYRLSARGEFSRDFTLKDQMRRAAVSIGSNIAEGFERGGDKEFRQFLSHAKGSCGEVRSQLYTALDENYVSKDEFESLYEQTNRTSRLISGFMTYLRDSEFRGNKYR